MNNEKDMVGTRDVETYAKTTRTKSSRKNGRFNFIDFILLLIIVAVVAAVVIYFVPDALDSLASDEETEITFTIEFKGVDGDFVSNIENGDTVYDGSKAYFLGTVKSVENYAYSTLVYNESTGLAEMREHPELKNVIVTISASAVYTEGEGYSINGQRIAVGKSYDIRFPQFSHSGYCIEISLSTN